ncbi:MAG: methionyl-tRNA formyltransferase [Firmicutes bacterium]|nr:methionyl-tRNA formyltransferase [Bacillota bacterium]
MKDLKVIFMGTPDFAVPVLEYLIENTNVVLVVTQPDKEVGRDKKISFSPIKKLAIKYNVEVFQPLKIRKDFEIISEINPDIIITCAYGQIIPKAILDIPKLGCINVHASLLPEYRGASPMQWAILDGKKETGVTIMYMDEGMDTGDIISKKKCAITDDDTIGSLHDKLSILGKELLEETLPSIVNRTNQRIPQDGNLATYTKLIKREDELIDFNDCGEKIINKIRAFSPWPLAYFRFNETEIKVIKASFEKKEKPSVGKITFDKKEMGIDCTDGIVKLERIKPFGKKEMDIVAYLNGVQKVEGMYIGKE